MGPGAGGWGGICQVEERMRPFQVGNSKGNRAGEQHSAAGVSTGNAGRTTQRQGMGYEGP